MEENGVQDAVRRRRPSPKLQQGESARSWISFVDCWCGCLSLLSLLVGDVSFVVVAVAVIVGGGVVHAVVVWYWVVITFMLSLLSYATPAHEKKKRNPSDGNPLQVDGDSVDNLPPSWQRDVEGRQTREEAEAELKANAEAANKEDAVSSKRSSVRITIRLYVWYMEATNKIAGTCELSYQRYMQGT